MFSLQSSLIASFFRFCQFDSIVTNSYSLAQDFCRNIYIFSAYYLPSKYPIIRYLDLYANYSHAVTILLLPDSHALQWNIIISYYFVYYAKKDNIITIASLNVRGLGNSAKRRETFHWLKSKKFSIYLLQEVHCSEETSHLCASEWGYKILFTSFSSSKAGVSILFNNNFDL